MKPWFLLFTCLLLCRAGVAESVAKGEHFRVICHFDARGLEFEALQAAEAVWPLAARFYGLAPREKLRKRMVIHIYRDMQAYAAAEGKLTFGRFRFSGAFSAWATKEAHVALQPAGPDGLLKRLGLPLLTKLMIAHEACHVIGYHAVPNAHIHPLWYAEGLATWAATRAIVEADAGLDPGTDPFTSRMMQLLVGLQKRGALPDPNAVASGDVGRIGGYEQYAVWWGLFRFLMEGRHSKQLLEMARDVNAGRGGPDPRHSLMKRVAALDLKRAFEAYVSRLSPMWDEVRRSLEWADGKWVQRAFETSRASAWRTAPAGAGPYTISGSVRLLPAHAHTARVLLARTDAAYLSVDFAAGRGVRLMRHDTKSGARDVLADARTGKCGVDVPLRFEISVRAGRLKLKLDGKAVLEGDLGTHPMHGPWGLGLDPGAAAEWRLRRHPGPKPRRGGPGLPENAAALAGRIRKAPDATDVLHAIGKLGSLGRDGLRSLDHMVAHFARRRPALARAAALQLGEADEALRFTLLRLRYRPAYPAAVRGAILVGLAERYPEDAAWFHEALAPGSDVTDRPRIFAEVAPRLPDEFVRRGLASLETASTAYTELVRRKQKITAKELALVGRNEARLGVSRHYLRHFQERLRTGVGWELLEAIARLVQDGEQAVRDGAQALLLGVSGRDIAADPVLWHSWIAARRDRYEVPDELSEGAIASAVLRGAAYLRRPLLEQGFCTWNEMSVGPGASPARQTAAATAMAVLALRAAGVPRDDRAIVRAVEETLLKRNESGLLVVDRDKTSFNYTAAMVTMALGAVDPKRYRSKIQTIASRLAAGQLPSGQWTYYTGDRYRRKKDGKPAKRRLIGDASNTQYAVLGLRAAQKAGADIDPGVWRRALQMYREGQDEWGGWGYAVVPFSGVERTMTPAAIAGIVICLEGLYGKDAARWIEGSSALRRGLIRQGQLLIGWGYRGFDHYAFYGVERACILTGTRLFNNYDWYRVGALDLLERQREDGSWHGRARGRPHEQFEYGPHIDTAYALLFLKRATTKVDGVSTAGRVACPPGPKTIRKWTVPWWPYKPPDPKR